MQQTTRQPRRAWHRTALGLAAAAALALGLGPAPSAQAAPATVYLSNVSFPTASDPAKGNFPRWQSTLNLANGEQYFLHSTASGYIMDALFTDSADGAGDGGLAYCVEPSRLAELDGPSDITWENADYLGSFPMAGAAHLRTVLGADANSILEKSLGAIMANGFSEAPTRAEMSQWRWDDPNQGPKLASWVATQLLVWETTVGERKADFSYNPVDPGQNPISDVAFSQTDASYQPYKNMIRAEYDRIAAAVQNQLKMPSFLDPVTEPTYDMNWDGSRFSVTLNDTNGVVPQTTFGGAPGLKIEKSGSSVTFSVGMEDLVENPDGSLQDFPMTASKTLAASGTVAWGRPGKQRVMAASTPKVALSAKARFKPVVGSTLLEKELASHKFDGSVTGAGIDYPGSPNWFEYTPVKDLGTNPVQTFDLIAGNKRGKVGTMTVTNNFDRTITVSYALKPGLTNDGTAQLALLNGVEELTTVAPDQQPYAMQESSITLRLSGLTRTRTVGEGAAAHEVVDRIAPAINDVNNFILFFHTNAKGYINTGWAEYSTPFYAKLTGPSYPDGHVFSFSVDTPDKIFLAPGVYSVVEVADAQGTPFDGFWDVTYSTKQFTVAAGEEVPVTITNARATSSEDETPTPTEKPTTPGDKPTTPSEKPLKPAGSGPSGPLASTGASGLGTLLPVALTVLGLGTALLVARRRTAL